MDKFLVYINTTDKGQRVMQIKMPFKYYMTLLRLSAFLMIKNAKKFNDSRVIAFCILHQAERLIQSPPSTVWVDYFQIGKRLRGRKIHVQMPQDVNEAFEKVRAFLISKDLKPLTPAQAISWCLEETMRALNVVISGNY